MNENTSFTKMFLLNSLNARTDHDVRFNKIRHKKSMTSNLILKQRHFNGDTSQGPLGQKIGPVRIVCRFMVTYIKTFNGVLPLI